MAAGRTLRSLVSRRRRADEEGEDEEGPVFMDDSQSEASGVSEPDDEDEADTASMGGLDAAEAGASEAAAVDDGTTADARVARKSKKSRKRQIKASAETTKPAQTSAPPEFKASTDTDAMMNGLSAVSREVAEEEVEDFEGVAQNGSTAAVPRHFNGDTLSAAEKQRREHEEYRRKRDSNPAFIPNRGNFFMHDTRGQNSGPPPVTRGGWQARGRGRGSAHVGGPFSPSTQMAVAERAAEQPWKHDLHDTINEEPIASAAAPEPSAPMGAASVQTYSNRLFPKTVQHPVPTPSAPISFDSTTLLGTMQVRVFLPGMKEPKAVSAAPVKRYVRLPNHRPPLRRDKPVRISLPDYPQRHIFPAPDRSFIFIPRQMRANQQGYQRGYQRSIGGGYGYTSRRTSMHGSMYSASVAPSRRSSLAGISRDRAFSPAGSFVGMPPSRPVVRLSYGSGPPSAVSTPQGPLSGYQTPTGMQVHTYPLPQPPQFQGTPTTTMHQPRPQKAISVTGIESPAMLQQPPAETQPFQNQLPAHINEQAGYQQPPALPQPYFSPHQQYQYPVPQPQAGTPLSGIPEQAIHAPSFQPPAFGQPAYYPHYPPQQNFYYSPPGPNGYPQMPPMYMMAPPPQGYMLPPPGATMNPPQPAQEQSRPISSSGEDQNTPSGMVAHESNGMVFYVPASEAQSSEHYQPAEGFVPSYAMPGLPPPTPAPDNSMQYYYPPMPHGGMQDVGNGVYYPAQQ